MLRGSDLDAMAATDSAVGGLLVGVGIVTGLYIEVQGFVLCAVGAGMLLWSAWLLRQRRYAYMPGDWIWES